jgi:hypothetical protein
MLPKNSTFSDRQAASAAAKKALLEKFKPKPMVVAAEPIDHDKERRERLEAIRAEREVERLERQRAREEAARIAEEERVAALVAAETARVEAELSVDAMKRAERKERKKAIKDAARQKKEVRQTVKSTPVQERLSPREEHERYIRDLERARA